MEVVVIEKKFQSEFLNAVIQGELKKFIASPDNCIFFNKVIRLLKSVHSRKFTSRSQAICNDFSKALNSLAARIDSAKCPLNEWKRFYIDNEDDLEKIIEKSRKKNVVDFRIEGFREKLYLKFKSARRSYREKQGVSSLTLDPRQGIDKELIDSLDRRLKYLYFFDDGKESKRCQEVCDDFSSFTHLLGTKDFKPLLKKIVEKCRKEKLIDIRIDETVKPSNGNFSRKAECTVPASTTGRSSTAPNTLQRTEIERAIREEQDLEEHRLRMRIDIPSEIIDFPSSNNTPSVSTSPPQNSIDWDAKRAEQAQDYQRRLHSINEHYDAEVQKHREELKRVEEEGRLEMLEMQRKSAEMVRCFVQCARLKLHWEQQEDTWNQFLTTARRPVIRLKIELSHARWNVLRLRNLALAAYRCLMETFENVQTLSAEFDDKLFLRVIMTRVSGVATSVCRLIENVGQAQQGRESIDRVKMWAESVRPHDIPSTDELRRVCTTARPQDYDIVERPRQLSPDYF